MQWFFLPNIVVRCSLVSHQTHLKNHTGSFLHNHAKNIEAQKVHVFAISGWVTLRMVWQIETKSNLFKKAEIRAVNLGHTRSLFSASSWQGSTFTSVESWAILLFMFKI